MSPGASSYHNTTSPILWQGSPTESFNQPMPVFVQPRIHHPPHFSSLPSPALSILRAPPVQHELASNPMRMFNWQTSKMHNALSEFDSSTAKPTEKDEEPSKEENQHEGVCKSKNCYLCTHGIVSLLDSEDVNLNPKSLGCREVVLAILSYLTLRHPKDWYTLNQDIYPLLLTHSNFIPQKSHNKRSIKRALQDTLSHNRRYFKSARKELNQNGRWKLTKMYRKWLVNVKGHQYWEVADE